MPHVIALWPGKSEKEKAELAEEITKSVTEVLNYGEDSVSVAMEEVPASDWAEKVLHARHREQCSEFCQE